MVREGGGMATPSAERSRRFRARLRQDPVANANALRKEADRKRRRRAAIKQGREDSRARRHFELHFEAWDRRRRAREADQARWSEPASSRFV